MHNQLEQFKSSLSKPWNPLGDCYSLVIENHNPECLLIDDFKKNYMPFEDDFELKIANNHPYLKRMTNSWNAFLDNELKIIYAHNSEFFSMYDGTICLAEPKDYLAQKLVFNIEKEKCEYELQRIFDLKEKTSINKTIKYFKIDSYKKYNHLESVIKGIKINPAIFKGEEYYVMSCKMKSELKKDISAFYGEQKELEQLINELNYKENFIYSILVNAKSLKCEMVFNNLFAFGNRASNEITIKTLDEVLTNEVIKIKIKANYPPMPPRGPPGISNNSIHSYNAAYETNLSYPPKRPEEMNKAPKSKVPNIPEGTFLNMAKNNSPQKKAEPKTDDDSESAEYELLYKIQKYG